jgi:hypothetical protein
MLMPQLSCLKSGFLGENFIWKPKQNMKETIDCGFSVRVEWDMSRGNLTKIEGATSVLVKMIQNRKKHAAP